MVCMILCANTHTHRQINDDKNTEKNLNNRERAQQHHSFMRGERDNVINY